MTRDEALVVGILPHGQTRARRPPGIEDLGVWTRSGTYPLKEVENQSFNGVGNRRLQDTRDVCSSIL
jgi:hypothetical protein